MFSLTEFAREMNKIVYLIETEISPISITAISDNESAICLLSDIKQRFLSGIKIAFVKRYTRSRRLKFIIMEIMQICFRSDKKHCLKSHILRDERSFISTEKK